MAYKNYILKGDKTMVETTQCPYCSIREWTNAHIGMGMYYLWGSFYLQRHEDGKYSLVREVKDGYEVLVHIKYCPMCGRKLSGEGDVNV